MKRDTGGEKNKREREREGDKKDRRTDSICLETFINGADRLREFRVSNVGETEGKKKTE